MLNVGMGKNPMANNVTATLTNKVATSAHIGMNDGLIGNSFSSTGLMGGVSNAMGMKQPGSQQMIGSVGSLNMGQQLPNQMMNGPNSFTSNMGQLRGIPNSVSPSTSMQMPQTGMMSNPGMTQMQGITGHLSMNMQQNSAQVVRVSIVLVQFFFNPLSGSVKKKFC